MIEKGELLVPKDVVGETPAERERTARRGFRALRVLEPDADPLVVRMEGTGRYNYGPPEIMPAVDLDRDWERP